MYQVDDMVVYGDMGVCRIIEIQEKKFSEAADSRLYYTLMPLFQECMIHTPVNGAKVFMRPIISAEKANQLIDMIPSIQAEAYHNKVLSELTEHYRASLETHDCADLIELTMSIYAKKQEIAEQNRKIGAVDERFMKRAEDLLFGELSAALGIPKEDVSAYISSRVQGYVPARE